MRAAGAEAPPAPSGRSRYRMRRQLSIYGALLRPGCAGLARLSPRNQRLLWVDRANDLHSPAMCAPQCLPALLCFHMLRVVQDLIRDAGNTVPPIPCRLTTAAL